MSWTRRTSLRPDEGSLEADGRTPSESMAAMTEAITPERTAHGMRLPAVDPCDRLEGARELRDELPGAAPVEDEPLGRFAAR